MDDNEPRMARIFADRMSRNLSMRWLLQKSVILCVALALAALFNTALDPSKCIADDHAKQWPTIEGRVTDREGKPVVDALVQWGYWLDAPEKLQQTTTDAEGKYRLQVREWGSNYRLGISADGMAPQWSIPYSNDSFDDVLNDPKNLPPATADFKLEPQHRLTGIVVDDDGQPIPAVTIRAETAVKGPSPYFSSFSTFTPSMPIPGLAARATSTGPDGRFAFDHLPEGKVHLRFETPYRHANSENFPVDQEAKIQMRGSGRQGIIRLRVIDAEDKDPVTEYVVLVCHRSTPQTVSALEGRIELKQDFAEGYPYSLHIFSKHHEPTKAQAIALPLGSKRETEIKLRPGKPLLGRMIDATTNEPIREGTLLHAVFVNERNMSMNWGDSLQFCDGGPLLTDIQRHTTDEHGSFWFSEYRRNGTLFILTPGYERMILEPTDLAEPGDDGHVQVKLGAEAAVSGTLVHDGKPQANVEIFVQKEEPRGKYAETYEKIFTDAEGKFRVGSLSAGTYDISYWTYPSHSLSKAKPIATVKLASGEQKTLEPFAIGDLGVRKE
jgi:hypothetical protein